MGGLIGRFGPTRLAAVAFACLVIAYAVFLRAGVQPDYPSVMLPTVILIGVAFGLGFSSLSVAATAGVPNEEQGLASSLFQTSFQVGGAVVLAIVTAVVDAGGASKVISPSASGVPAVAGADHHRRGGRDAGHARRAAAAGRGAHPGFGAGGRADRAAELADDNTAA